ncbi:hypothetical protein OG905_38980 [Streptomyces sp. NBC_00322]|uniref:hypothetical protein n=1 Tax=Streptomyces sp. NBC_00322 TaxID=2975712 RepID=UPI002E283FF2|nr:hypothetical protein [Streptomyces sp. NBC_00322]
MSVTSAQAFDPGEDPVLLQQIREILSDDRRSDLERFIRTVPLAGARCAAVEPQAVCPHCTKRNENLVRNKRRLITTAQSTLGLCATGLGTTGVVLFVDGAPLEASAAGVLAGLFVTGVRALQKLKPGR